MNPRRAERGFNIIEIVVTLAIISLLFTFAMPTYSLWLQNSQLRASAESFVSGLQHARSEAVRRNNTQGVKLVIAGNAWRVETVAPPVAPETNPLQQGGGLDLAKNAVVTPTPAVAEAVFTSLGQTTLAANVNIDVTHVDPALKCRADGGEMRCLRVQVRTGGLVRLCDPSITAVGDPRLCLP